MVGLFFIFLSPFYVFDPIIRHRIWAKPNWWIVVLVQVQVALTLWYVSDAPDGQSEKLPFFLIVAFSWAHFLWWKLYFRRQREVN